MGVDSKKCRQALEPWRHRWDRLWILLLRIVSPSG